MRKRVKTTIILITLLAAAGVHGRAFAQEGAVTDIDGNIYRTVKIGDQIWMAENLKTTRLNNGETIPCVQDIVEWGNLRSPGLCWYEASHFIRDSAGYVDAYGFIYNWHAVETGKLCPQGWHVPTETEWRKLRNYLGEWEAGYKLKEQGTEHWTGTRDIITNESGFSARGAGVRMITREGREIYEFIFIGEYAGFWSSSTTREGDPVSFGIYSSIVRGGDVHNDGRVRRFYVRSTKEKAYSMRCIKSDPGSR